MREDWRFVLCSVHGKRPVFESLIGNRVEFGGTDVDCWGACNDRAQLLKLSLGGLTTTVEVNGRHLTINTAEHWGYRGQRSVLGSDWDREAEAIISDWSLDLKCAIWARGSWLFMRSPCDSLYDADSWKCSSPTSHAISICDPIAKSAEGEWRDAAWLPVSMSTLPACVGHRAYASWGVSAIETGTAGSPRLRLWLRPQHLGWMDFEEDKLRLWQMINIVLKPNHMR